jgi:hypothetical protein
MPDTADLVLFDQSALLYATYYLTQILVHRPFIASSRVSTPLSFPSLAICTNAARSGIHVLNIHGRKSQSTLLGANLPAFGFGIVLLLHIWGSKPTGYAKEMEEVQKCLDYMKRSERISHSNGRSWDLLTELANVGDLPSLADACESSRSKKRDRDQDSASASASTPSDDSGFRGDRPIAGANRAEIARQSLDQPLMQQVNMEQILSEQSMFTGMPSAPANMFTLPVHTGELGRLPLNGQVSFSTTNPAQAKPHFGSPPQPSKHHQAHMNTAALASMDPNSTDLSLSWLASSESPPGPASADTASFPMDQPFFDQPSLDFNGGQGQYPFQFAFPDFFQSQHNELSQPTSDPTGAQDLNTIWSEAPSNFQ